MQRTCRECRETFTVDPADLAFLEKVSPVFNGKKELIPPPTFCPQCRLQRRLAFRNQIHVYQRRSSMSGNAIFSHWAEDVPFPVFDNAEWYGDAWDPLVHGRDPDFSRPFFEQMADLHNVVPHPARSVIPEMVNSDYANNATALKNCYLVFNASNAEDCMYCENAWRSRNCIECTRIPDAELCYNCTGCIGCYNVQDSEFCENCSDSFFLSRCRGCRHCFGCINLRHREYCIWNERKTAREFADFMKAFNGSSHAPRANIRRKAEWFFREHPRPHADMSHVEDVSGNQIFRSKNVHDSYFIDYGEDLRYCFGVENGAKDCHDHSLFGDKAELTYEVAIGGADVVRLLFCAGVLNQSSDCFYCLICMQTRHCFGCVGLKRREYCIFNKQYTKEEYERIVPRIIEHMRNDGRAMNRSTTDNAAEGNRATGSWGEFFPMTMSPIAYNHSLAQRYFPLSKEEALGRGLKWHEKDTEDVRSAIEASELPDELPATDDPIIVRSALSGRPFKITSQEIRRYRELRVPLPRTTYDERMEERIRLLGGIRLYQRMCAKTGKTILTTHLHDAPYVIWDRDVYEQEFGA